MNDIEPVKENSSKTLTKQGVNAVVGIGGGLAMLLLTGPLGVILGGVSAVVGIVALNSRDPEDKKPGTAFTVAGFLAIAAKIGMPAIIKSIAGTLLGIGAVGLIATGVWNGIKFLKGLKSQK
jgi:hypothetical protein